MSFSKEGTHGNDADILLNFELIFCVPSFHPAKAPSNGKPHFQCFPDQWYAEVPVGGAPKFPIG
jgi:hypothetical protein